MQRLRSSTHWTPRRRRGAALQLILGGLLIMVAPAVLGDTSIAAGFRAIAPVAWLMTVAGAAVLLLLREPRVRPSARAEAKPSGAVPLNPVPVKPKKVDRPMARPDLDPLDWFVDTEVPREPPRRPR